MRDISDSNQNNPSNDDPELTPETVNEYVKGEEFNEETFLSKAKSFASKVPFTRDLMAMYYAFLDSKVPVASKATITAALLYFVLPIDAIPDLIPVLGFTDDAAAIGLALTAISSSLNPEHYEKAEEFLNSEQNDGDDEEETFV